MTTASATSGNTQLSTATTSTPTKAIFAALLVATTCATLLRPSMDSAETAKPQSDHSDLQHASALEQLRHATAAVRDIDRSVAAVEAELAALADESALTPLPGRERWQRAVGWSISKARVLALATQGERVIAADQTGAIHLLADTQRRPLRSATPWTLAPKTQPKQVLLAVNEHAIIAAMGAQWLRADGEFQQPQRQTDRVSLVRDVTMVGETMIAVDGRDAWCRRKGANLPIRLAPGFGPQYLAKAGAHILIGGHRGALLLVDPSTRLAVAEHHPLADNRGLRSIAVHAASGVIAAGRNDGSITLHRMDDLAPIARLDRHLHPVGHLRFSSDGRYLASTVGTAYNPRISSPARCIIWHLPSRRMEALVTPGGRNTTALDYDAERDLLAIAIGRDVRLYAIPSGEQIARFRVGGKQVPQSLAFAADGSLVVGTNGGMVHRYRNVPQAAAAPGTPQRRVDAEALPAAAELNEF